MPALGFPKSVPPTAQLDGTKTPGDSQRMEITDIYPGVLRSALMRVTVSSHTHSQGPVMLPQSLSLYPPRACI